jgi:hypothetical protein
MVMQASTRRDEEGIELGGAPSEASEGGRIELEEEERAVSLPGGPRLLEGECGMARLDVPPMNPVLVLPLHELMSAVVPQILMMSHATNTPHNTQQAPVGDGVHHVTKGEGGVHLGLVQHHPDARIGVTLVTQAIEEATSETGRAIPPTRHTTTTHRFAETTQP